MIYGYRDEGGILWFLQGSTTVYNLLPFNGGRLLVTRSEVRSGTPTRYLIVVVVVDYTSIFTS